MKEPTIITSLDDIGTEPVKVMVKRPDGKRVAVMLRPLSEDEIWQLRKTVPRLKPPLKSIERIAGRIQEIYDYDHEDYVKAVEESDRLFANKMLLASLLLDIPGETEEERLAALSKRLGKYAHSQLVAAVQRLNIISQKELADVSASFQFDGHPLASGNGAAEHDAGSVAEIAPE